MHGSRFMVHTSELVYHQFKFMNIDQILWSILVKLKVILKFIIHSFAIVTCNSCSNSLTPFACKLGS